MPKAFECCGVVWVGFLKVVIMLAGPPSEGGVGPAATESSGADTARTARSDAKAIFSFVSVCVSRPVVLHGVAE